MLPETLVGKGLPSAVGDSTFGGVGVGVTEGSGVEGFKLSGSQVWPSRVTSALLASGIDQKTGTGAANNCSRHFDARGCGAVGDPSLAFTGAVSVLAHESDARVFCSSELVTVCAWCVGEGIPQKIAKDAKVSHGICARHLLEQRAELAAMDWRRK
jgi:hypothetical protein